MKFVKLSYPLFVLMLAGALFVALHPPADAPVYFRSDKLAHLLAFAGLSFVCRLIWQRARLGILFLLLAAFGGLIEFSQAYMGFGRDAEWLDIGANLGGICIGFAVAQVIIAVSRRAAAEPD